MSNSLSLVNSVFGWAIAVMALVGFFYTKQRTGHGWPAWLLLSAGWALFALAQTLVLIEAPIALPLLIALWLSSYALIMTSILLLFLTIIRLKSSKE